MTHRILLAVMTMLLLAGCGRGSEDFTVAIDRPPARVAVALDRVAIDQEIGMVIPNLRVKRSEPALGQILYTIPGDSEFEATILLTLEPSKDGKATVVHAAVDVPRVEVEFAGKMKVISESRVERELRKIIMKVGTELQEGKSVDRPRAEFSELLTVLAIVTDSKQLRLAKDMEKNPESFMDALAGLNEGGESDADYPDQAYGDPTIPEDPGGAARQSEHREEALAREASEPMEEAEGDSASGEYPSGSDY